MTTQFKEQTIKGYVEQIFGHYDSNKTGTLNLASTTQFFNQLFMSLNIPISVSPQQAVDLIKMVHPGYSGFLNKQELYQTIVMMLRFTTEGASVFNYKPVQNINNFNPMINGNFINPNMYNGGMNQANLMQNGQYMIMRPNQAQQQMPMYQANMANLYQQRLQQQQQQQNFQNNNK